MARGTDTYIYTVGSSPNTRVAISQKNRVLSKPYAKGTITQKQIGVLSTFDYTESRSLDPVRGVGFGDKIAELVPGVTEPMGITLNRTLLYTAGIVQELGYKGGVDGIVRSLRQHKWPFDIQSELVFSELIKTQDADQLGDGIVPNSDGSLSLITYFLGCWLESYDVSFPSDSAIVVENCGGKATDVTDGVHNYIQGDPNSYGESLDSGNNPFLQSGSGSRLYGT
jgi:hypothetical protein